MRDFNPCLLFSWTVDFLEDPWACYFNSDPMRGKGPIIRMKAVVVWPYFYTFTIGLVGMIFFSHLCLRWMLGLLGLAFEHVCNSRWISYILKLWEWISCETPSMRINFDPLGLCINSSGTLPIYNMQKHCNFNFSGLLNSLPIRLEWKVVHGPVYQGLKGVSGSLDPKKKSYQLLSLYRFFFLRGQL